MCVDLFFFLPFDSLFFLPSPILIKICAFFLHILCAKLSSAVKRADCIILTL